MFHFLQDNLCGSEDSGKVEQALNISSKRVEFPSWWQSKDKDAQPDVAKLVSDTPENSEMSNGGSEEMVANEQETLLATVPEAMPEPPKQMNPFATEFIPKTSPAPGVDVGVELPPKEVFPPKSVPVPSQPIAAGLVRHQMPSQVSASPGFQVNPPKPILQHQQFRDQPPPMSISHHAPLTNSDNINTTYMSPMVPISALNSYPAPHPSTILATQERYQPSQLYGQQEPRHHTGHHTGQHMGRVGQRGGPMHHGYRAPVDALSGPHLPGMPATHTSAPSYAGFPPGTQVAGPAAHMGVMSPPQANIHVQSLQHSASTVPQIQLLKREKPVESPAPRPVEGSTTPHCGGEPHGSNSVDVAPQVSTVLKDTPKISSVVASSDGGVVQQETSKDDGVPKNAGGFVFQFGDLMPDTITAKNKNVQIFTAKPSTAATKSHRKASESSTKPPPAPSVPAPTVIEVKASPEVSSAKERAPGLTSPQLTKDVLPQTNGLAKSPPGTVKGSLSNDRITSPLTTAPSPPDNAPLASPPNAQAPPKSWANLFASSSSGSKPVELSSVVKKEPQPQVITNGSANDLGAILANMKLSQLAVPLQARRLVNHANWCYVNATLQALLACPPFYHALKALPAYPPLSNSQSATPVLDAMVEFVNEFGEMKSEKLSEKGKRKRDLRSGDPFEPTSVYNVLTVMKTSDSMFVRGKQEDAEEFLTCLLNKIHEEVAEAIKQHEKKNITPETMMNGHKQGASDQEEDDGQDWEQVGPKNKSVITHSNVDKTTTPILQIFGGQLRSSFHTGGNNAESVTLEQFFTVPLNVQTNKTVEEALHAFVSKESIDDYTCPQTKQELDAHRKLTFEHLPPILILHLKCFVYDKHGGSQKVLHNMTFSENLDFDKELLSKRYVPKDHRSYELFAVVYHSGTKTTGGHYHTDVYHTGVKSWVRFDDNSTTPISESEVFNFKHPCVPYLLYYRRADTQQPASNIHKHGALHSN